MCYHRSPAGRRFYWYVTGGVMSSSMLKTVVLGLIFLAAIAVVALAEEIPYTLADRERLICVETKPEEMEQRFGQMTTLFLGIVVAFAGVVVATIGFAAWDRRTALTPALRPRHGRPYSMSSGSMTSMPI